MADKLARAKADKLAKGTFVGNGPVKYKVEATPDSDYSRVLVHIDYTDAPLPQHYYVADFFSVTSLGSTVLLTFGKFDNIKKREKLRSKVEIYFPSVAFVRQFWTTSRDLHKTLRRWVAAHPFELAESSNTADETAEKIQTLQSNNVMMVLSSGETVLDFYYMSPRELFLKTKKNKEVELEPLVRILVEPQMLLGFLDECEPIAEFLKPVVGEEE